MSHDADYSDLLHPQTPLKTPPPTHLPLVEVMGLVSPLIIFFLLFFMIYSVFALFENLLCALRPAE